MDCDLSSSVPVVITSEFECFVLEYVIDGAVRGYVVSRLSRVPQSRHNSAQNQENSIHASFASFYFYGQPTVYCTSITDHDVQYRQNVHGISHSYIQWW